MRQLALLFALLTAGLVLAAALFLIAQNAVGPGAALLLDLHPLVGLLSNSITLSGGHGLRHLRTCDWRPALRA